MRKSHLLTLLVTTWTLTLSADLIDSYYSGADGQVGASLKQALYLRISSPNDVLGYGSGYGNTWNGFYQIDNRGNNRVWDMYSNKTRYFNSSYKGTSGMNIEHSIPKSWWGTDLEPENPYSYRNSKAYVDLHHLCPSDATANMAKSNYSVGEVMGDPPYNEDYNIVPFNNNITKVGAPDPSWGYYSMVFEPADEYKGDFARMYMYIVTCYQDLAPKWRSSATGCFYNNTYPTFRPWISKLLMQWHRQDPVSQKDIDRNEGIYQIQHNRNPYIDFANLAEYVWGDSVTVKFPLKTTIRGAHTTSSVAELPLLEGSIFTQDNTLHITGVNQGTVITIVDINGSTILHQSLSEGALEQPLPHSGLYIIKLANDTQYQISKVIVQ